MKIHHRRNGEHSGNRHIPEPAIVFLFEVSQTPVYQRPVLHTAYFDDGHKKIIINLLKSNPSTIDCSLITISLLHEGTATGTAKPAYICKVIFST